MQPVTENIRCPQFKLRKARKKQETTMPNLRETIALDGIFYKILSACQELSRSNLTCLSC